MSVEHLEAAETEDNCLITCGHCNGNVGRIKEILEEDFASKHLCLKDCLNVEMDFDTKTIYRSLRQMKLDSSLKPTSGTYNNNNTDGASTSKENQPANTMEGEAKCTWTHEAIKLLIFSFVKHKDKFESAKYTKKTVWEIICNELKKKEIIKTPQKCDEKWRNLKKTYDKIKTEKDKTGNHSVNWRYFEEFQEIYFRDPYFEPVASVSSTGLVKTRQTSEIPLVKQDIVPRCGRNLSPGETSRKRSISSYESEQRKQKRHEEKMQFKREVFEWMKEHFSKSD